MNQPSALSGWQSHKIAYSFRLIGSGTTPDTEVPEYYDGGIPWVTTTELREKVILQTAKAVTAKALQHYSAVKVYPAGTLLVAMYGATIGRLGILGCPAAVNQACFALADSHAIDTRFAFYWFLAHREELIANAAGGGQPNLSQRFLAGLRICAPGIEEQVAIADFLDRETARIDTLNVQQHRLIALLEKSRQSLISQIVCRGLNSDVRFCHSGIGWLGETPAHWQLLPVKRLFRLVVEPAPENHNHELLSIYTGIGVRPRKELEQRGNKASTTDGYFTVRSGDFIVNKLLAWMGAIGLSDYDGVTSPAYDVLRPIREMDAHYYEYLFRCGICLTEFRRHSRGIMDMRLRLYFEDFGPLLMPYPPVREQRNIVEYLGIKTRPIEALIARSRQFVALLEEYRSALIAAAVTGQIDVRNYKAQGVASCQ